MGFLTTHVLDTAHGIPAKHMRLRLYEWQGQQRQLICEKVTNNDGRCDKPILDEANFKQGQYELEFEVASYFAAMGVVLAKPAFLDIVPIKFGIADTSAHYHVPLLVSPYGFSTYRGS